MNVHIRIPYSLEKNIGRQYNNEFILCPDGDALAFMDGDMMFTRNDYGYELSKYVNKYPDAVLTCLTNRTHNLSIWQQAPITSADVLTCLEYAEKIKDDFSVTEIPAHIPVSMLLMVIPKAIWEKYPFSEMNHYRPNEPNLLGCDNEWTNRIRRNGIKILRMNSVLMYHQYRLKNGSKSHLI